MRLKDYAIVSGNDKPVIRFVRQHGPWFVAGFIFLVVCFYYLLSPGVYGSTDNVTHFLYSRYAFRYPVFFLHPWARPLYTILSSPFAQFGFQGIQLFNVITGTATAWFCYKIARHLGLRPAAAAMLFACFMPLYFIMMPTGLTEILFSFVLVFSLYLFLKEQYFAAAVVISFLPFARSEGFFLLPFYFLALVYRRKFLAIPLLAAGTLFFSLAGWHYWEDFFWVFTKFPYQLHHPIYNQHGDLFHFLKYRDEIIGLPLEIMLLAGTVQLFREFFARDRGIRDRSVVLILLALAPFAFYLSFHSFLHWQGLGASIGLTRVLAGVLPLAAIVCLAGYSAILDAIRLAQVWRNLATLVITGLIIWITFKTYPFPFPQTPEEETVERTSLWIKSSPHAGKLLYYTDISTPFYLRIDPFKSDPHSCYLLTKCQTLDTIADGSLVFWDAHFGGNESWIPADSILGHPRMNLVKAFKPGIEWTTFGGKPYQCLVFTVLSTDQPSDNFAILDSMAFYAYENARETIIYENSFEAAEPARDTTQITQAVFRTGRHAAVLDRDHEYTPGLNRMISELPDRCDNRSMIRVTVFVNPPAPLTKPHTFLVISFENNNQSYSYTTLDLKDQSLKPGTWNKVKLQTRCPAIKSPADRLKAYIWDPEKELIYVDDMKVELVNPR